MGIYLNPGYDAFEEALNSEIFVDKSEMILFLNSIVKTKQKYVSVSRPRRFGKSMAADMIAAYYDADNDSRELFGKCKIAGHDLKNDVQLEWDHYLNKFDTIRLVMTKFFNSKTSISDGIKKINKLLMREILKAFPDVDYFDREDIIQSMEDIYAEKKRQFVIIIDEWDAVFREFKEDTKGQREYLDFLRDWLKDKEYIALAYMTGILPIKKYGKHSALNMFDEYSIIQPMQLAESCGFTGEEVAGLCRKYGRNFDEIKEWYDGYMVSGAVPADPEHEILNTTGKSPEATKYDIYSPLSVVRAVKSGVIDNYWNQTETYEALQTYVNLNFDGLREDVAVLMNGGRIKIDISGYQNDMTTFNTKDDILTMFIHLGYLTYDREKSEVYIPNGEVQQVFSASTKSKEWNVTFNALENSRKLLEATWNCDADTVAELIEAAHDKSGKRTYNSEAALSYSIQLAYYYAHEYYTLIPELDTGKGYADLVYIPTIPDKPALLIELKYSKDSGKALEQIKRRNYPDRLEHYKGNIILVAINYDKESNSNQPYYKHHSCRIERI